MFRNDVLKVGVGIAHFSSTHGNIIHVIGGIYCRVSQWLETGLGLVTGFINNLQVVTIINYYTIAASHNLQLRHTNLFSLSALVFTNL
jgi:hypothetical protein